MNVLIVLNDPPYGTERTYNGLRLAIALRRTEGVHLKVFLMADAVSGAKSGQKVPEGYYNVQQMLRGLTAREVPVAACGTCMDARGLADTDLIEGVRRGSMPELAAWTVEADRVLTF